MTELIVGLISSIVSGSVSWLFARKKYNSEVDHNLIQNMEQSLEFYKKLSDDNKLRLEALTLKNEALESEIQELKKQLFNLTMDICKDLTYESRIREQSKKMKHNIKKDRFDETKENKINEKS